MFLSDRWSPQEEALEVWRDAARLVSERWKAFLECEPETRRWAFAAYIAALDNEQAAAAELEALTARLAA